MPTMSPEKNSLLKRDGAARLTHSSRMGTLCRIVRVTGRKGSELIEAETESGVTFSSNKNQFEKDWVRI